MTTSNESQQPLQPILLAGKENLLPATGGGLTALYHQPRLPPGEECGLRALEDLCQMRPSFRTLFWSILGWKRRVITQLSGTTAARPCWRPLRELSKRRSSMRQWQSLPKSSLGCQHQPPGAALTLNRGLWAVTCCTPTSLSLGHIVDQ